MFVDIPAFLAASCALTGDLERARFYLESSCRSSAIASPRTSTGSGRTAAMAAARESLSTAPGHRSPRAGSPSRGLEEDPDARRPEAVARPVAQSPAWRGFAARARCGRWSSTGSPSSSPIRRASAIWRGCSIDRGLTHCLELADRPAETSGTAPQLDERARREIQARARDCSTTSTRPTPPMISAGRGAGT